MPKEARNLTKATLDSLRRRAKADPTFTAYMADAGQPGLAAWTRRGRVRFVFEYRPPAGGPRKRMQIDDYGAIALDQARAIARDYRAEVAGGLDPRVQRDEEQRAAITVAQAAKAYLADLKERAETGARRGKRSGYASAKRRLEKRILPVLGPLRLRDVTPQRVQRLHRSMKSTPVEANRVRTVLSAVYGWADRAGIIQDGFNPARHIEKFAEPGTRRALTTEELSSLGEALVQAEETGAVELVVEGVKKPKLYQIHRSVVLAVRFLALTGFRRSELLGHMSRDRRGKQEGLRWGDVDLESGVVRLRDSKTGAQTRVIGEAAVELLKKAQLSSARPSDPVCPGAIPGQPFIGIDRARRRLWEAAGLAGVDLHSLRHSYASIGAHLHSGRFAGHVSALLGHGYQSRAITERYITADPEGLRPAADAIAGEIARLLGLVERAEVIPFPDERGA